MTRRRLLGLIILFLFLSPVVSARVLDPDDPLIQAYLEYGESRLLDETSSGMIANVGEEIDWSQFWQTFKQYALWDLEWYDGSSWTSVKEDLDIQLSYPEPNECKINLVFDASHSGNYRLTFAINKLVRDYVEKLGKYQYELTYDDIIIIFDWSDCAEISGLQFSHGIKDDYFWFRMRRDNVPLGAHVEIDPATVATSTSSSAVAHGFQRKGFFAAGLFWAFYTDGTNAGWEFSADGAAWDGAFTSIGACASGRVFSVWFDGTYVHYTRLYNYDLFYRRGTPVNDGSITWSAVEQTVYDGSSGDTYWYPCITVDTNGYAWVVASKDDPAPWYRPYVLKNANNDGTWALDFAYELTATSDSYWRVAVIPLTSAKVYVVYCRGSQTPLGNLWNGAAWVGEENDLADYNIEDGYGFSAVANGDDVHFVYNRDVTYQIRYNKRTYGVGWDANDVLVQNAVTSSCSPALSVDPSMGDLYCFWTLTSTDHVYYKKYDGGWDADPTDWIDESTDDILIDNSLSSFYLDYGGYIGLFYVTKLASPYNVRFAYFETYVPIDTYTWTFESTTTTTSATTTSTATDTDIITTTTATTTISTDRTTSTGGTTNFNLWVDSFSDMGGKGGSWQTRVAPPPYLNDNIDNWIHEDKTGGATEGYFGFVDTSLGGIINSVTLYIECYGDDTNEQINVYINSNDGSGYDLEGFVTVDQTSYAYETLLCTSLDTWAEINFASMYLEYIGIAGGDDIYVRRAYLRVNYSPVTTITSCATTSTTSCETIVTTQYTSSCATTEIVEIWTVIQIIVDPITTETVTSQCATTVVTSCTTVGEISTITVEDGTTCTTELTCITTCETETFTHVTSTETTCETEIETECETTTVTHVTSIETICETETEIETECETECETETEIETVCETETVTHVTSTETSCETDTEIESETICETTTITSLTSITTCTTSILTSETTTTTGAAVVTVTGAWMDYNYTSILTIEGINISLPSNMLNQTYWMDPYCYNVSETIGAPGLHVDFNITDLPEGLISISLRNYFSYDGSDGHTFEIQAYNGSEWVMVYDIPDECCQWFNVSLSCLEGDFIDDDGLFRGRFYHSSPGNVNHEFCLAYGKLRAFVPYELGIVGGFSGGFFLSVIFLTIFGLIIYIWGQRTNWIYY